jgi:hypothetical protein
MVKSKELVLLYNDYKKELGTYTDSTTAAFMVIAHVVLDLKRALQSGITTIEKIQTFVTTEETKKDTGL